MKPGGGADLRRTLWVVHFPYLSLRHSPAPTQETLPSARARKSVDVVSCNVNRLGVSIAVQADLITNDPRCEAPKGIMAEIREFMEASRECGGLMTVGQAAKVLNVTSSQVSVWAARGRIKAKVVVGVRMVSAGETLALLKERNAEGVKLGRRPIGKPASLADMVSSAWGDIDPIGMRD